MWRGVAGEAWTSLMETQCKYNFISINESAPMSLNFHENAVERGFNVKSFLLCINISSVINSPRKEESILKSTTGNFDYSERWKYISYSASDMDWICQRSKSKIKAGMNINFDADY